MKHTFLVTTLAALPLWLSPGPAAADGASHRQAVETLFRLTGMEQKIDESVSNVAQLQLQQNPQLQQAQREALITFLDRHIGWEALKEELAGMYLQNFTEQELDAMNAFYITPTGQKVITVVPQLVQQRNQLAMQRLQQNIGELQQLLNAEPAGQ